ncbi:unnamed protein product, partial [Effrenium voratum]
MPFWKSDWFLAEFAQHVYPTDGGGALLSFQVFCLAAEKLIQATDGKLQGLLGMMSETAQKAATGTVALIKAAEPLYRRLNNALESPEPQVIVFYLKAVKQLRSKVTQVGDACIIPLAVGSDIVPLLLERKAKPGSDTGEHCYRLTIVNAGDGSLYHRQSARCPPKLKYQTCLVFEGIPCDRAEDEAFWTTMVTACLISSEREPEELFYDTFLPYLINAPAVVDVLHPPEGKEKTSLSAPDTDFHSKPRCFGAWRSLTLLWKHLLRTRAEMTKQQVKALKWELRSTLAQMCLHDLKASKGLDSTDLRLLKIGCGTLSFAAVRNHTAATDVRSDEDTLSLPASTKSLWECRRIVDSIEVVCSQKPRTYEGQDGSGEFASFLDLDNGEEKTCQSAVFPFFDRLLRQEVFPGKPKGVADQLPIDLLALPEKVSSMTELFRTLRIAEEICLKLSFISRERCEYAPYLLVCLQQHLFTKLLPLPRGPYSTKQEECDIWGSWDTAHPTVTRPMQLDMLQVLLRLTELFVCSSLEMRCKSHTARVFDAVKITVLSAAAAMADRVIRIWPMDDRLFKADERPSELTRALHEGRFAVDAAAFVVQSETMEACFQELAITRAATVSYFHEVIQHYKVNLDRRRTVIFDYSMHKWGMWVTGERGTMAMVERMAATKLLADGNPQNLVAGTNVMMPHIWPEFQAYRDIVFWWKFFLCTDVRVFPEPRQFHPSEAIARWSVQTDDKGRQYFKVLGLGKDNVVWLNERTPPQPPASGHRWPSPALPAMHTKGEVRTEDDLLYQRSLPNFADEKTGRPMLRPSDSEALLSYLTVPYLRQPLLLSFFTTQDRSNCLRQGTLQKILQATMLEPGKLLYPQDMHKIPEFVPAVAEEEHLVASPFSQILTELSHGPSQILTAVGKLMALTLSLATSVTSETVPAILFSVRLAVRVESAAALLAEHAEGKMARAWPRLQVTSAVLEELRRGRALLRSTFEGEVLPWFDRWLEELAESAQQEPSREDECNSLACRLHAHQVLVLRNVPQSDFNSDRIRRFLASMTYLSSHHTFNQERLEVPETELFEALQLHRRFMVRWLVEQRRINAMQGFNSVLRSCHQQLSALGDTSAPETAGFEWVCVGDHSEYEGRFGVLSESAPDKDAQGSEEAAKAAKAPSKDIKTVNASDAFWIELNVQLLQVTVRGRTLVPLEDHIWNDGDFRHVFVSELGEKGATQKTTVQCSALLTSSNATVRELLSIPFRATYWASKPANYLPFMDEWDRLYDVEDLEEDEFWIAELFEPVRQKFFIPPPPKRPPLFFMKDEPIQPDTTVVCMVGMHQEAKARIWKEIYLYRDRRMIQVFGISGYGQQLYRQLEYSSNARLCLRELQPALDERPQPWAVWERYEAGGSSCDLVNHDASTTVSRTAVKGSGGFGGEVEAQTDPMDDPEEWDEVNSGGERSTNAAVKEDEQELEEDGIMRRRKPLRAVPAELLATACRNGHELQPEKKKSNRCNFCSASGTAYRCRDCDYDLCDACQRNLSRRVAVRFQEGDRIIVKGSGYTRKDGVDWRLCFYTANDCCFSFAPCTQRKCILRNSMIDAQKGSEIRSGGCPLGAEGEEFEVSFEKSDEGFELKINGERQADFDFPDRSAEGVEYIGFDCRAGNIKDVEICHDRMLTEKSPFERMPLGVLLGCGADVG